MQLSVRKNITLFLSRSIFGAMLILFGLSSCKSDVDKGKLMAQVGDSQLYENDLDFLIKSTTFSYEDSAEIVSTYINDWVNRQIMVNEANVNDAVNKTEIDRKVMEFKKDLLIHELENMKIKEALDTHVNDAEIEAYYQAHQQDFELNDYLVKVLYLKIPLDAPEIEKIGNAYKLRKNNDLEEIEVYAKMYASNFYYDIDSWIYFDDLLKEIPLHDINKDQFILKRSKIRFEENGFHYFLNIVDYKLKNSISPLNFERENIKARIINSRIKVLRESIRTDIIKKAYEQNAVTLY